MIDRDFKPILFDGAYEKGHWSLENYLQKGGYEAAKKVLAMPRDPKANNVPDMIEDVKRSNLRGRGGAGFPAGLKWSFVDYKTDKPRYLAVNCDESEPGTCKDRVIVMYNPHMLIEGILICCHTVGIEHAYIYIRGEYVVEFEHLVNACAEAYRAGYLGDNVLGSGYSFHVTPHRGAGAYVCGEETGLLSSVEGNRGYPKIKPPFPAVEGAWRCPTVVNNVQTIALLPSVVNMGADAWAQIGPERNSGPMIFCLSGHVNKPGLYETTMTVTMREVVDDFGGGIIDGLQPKAIIPGGSSMPVFRVDGKSYENSDGKEITDDYDIRMDFDTVKGAQSMLGSASMIVMHERTCMVNALYNLLRFYHHESCGQCTPCREGTGWLEKILARIVKGQGKTEDIDTLMSVAGQMTGTTICLLADSAVMPTGSFIIKFRDEFIHYCKEKKPIRDDFIRL